VGGKEGFQGAVVKEPDADFERGEGLEGLLVQIVPARVAIGRAIVRFWGGEQARVA
jgi:hypothetical protein